MGLEKLPVIRHLKDTDNLRDYEMDNPLMPSQEAEAQTIGKQLATEVLKEECRAIFLIVSPKRRAIETAGLIQRYFHNNHNNLKVSVSINDNLRELDQGQLILPHDYVSGTSFEPLPRAWEIFWDETFIKHNNPLYKFGDPVAQDGIPEYPELLGFFERYGECYRDLALRLYTLAHEFGKNLDRFKKIKPVVITHGSPVAIFKELERIAHDIQNGKDELKTGDLMRLTWDNFVSQEKDKQHPEFGSMQYISLENLTNTGILKRLHDEIISLKGLR